MAVIALPRFVVVPENTLPVCDKGKAVLVGMSRPAERFSKEPDNDLSEQLFAVRDAIADDECGLQGAQYGSRSGCCQPLQHPPGLRVQCRTTGRSKSTTAREPARNECTTYIDDVHEFGLPEGPARVPGQTALPSMLLSKH